MENEKHFAVMAWVTCPLRVKGHCKSHHCNVLLTDQIYTIYPAQSGLYSRMMIHRVWALTEWCYCNQNDRVYASNQIATKLNTYGRFWPSVLLHHHQNTRWGNKYFFPRKWDATVCCSRSYWWSYWCFCWIVAVLASRPMEYLWSRNGIVVLLFVFVSVEEESHTAHLLL